MGERFEAFSSGLDRERLADPLAFRTVRPDLPILLMAGEDDPVHEKMRRLHLLEQRLRNAGVRRVDTLYYLGGRHEMLNEINRDEVTADLIEWMDGVLGTAPH